MVVTKEEVLEQLSRVIAVIPQRYMDSLLTLHAKLNDQEVEWAVGGDLGEELRTINVDADCIEILTSKDGAMQIAEAVNEFNPSKVSLQTRQLSRNAVIESTEYPVFERSHYSEFTVSTVKVKVHGDLQYRIANWDWGDKLEFNPEYVNIVGKKIAVVPLILKYEFYQLLGWTDRVEKIKQTLDRLKPHTP